MRFLIIQHDDDGGPGVLLEPLAKAGEIARWNVWEQHDRPDLDGIDAIVSLGGTVHPDQDGTEPWLAEELDLLEEALDVGTPILGVCLGSQLLARAGGGSVGKVEQPEVARFCDIGLREEAGDDLLLAAFPRPFFGFEWHYYGSTPPPGATPLAANESALQAYRLQNRAWGLQFHIEVDAETLTAWADASPDEVERFGGRARYDKGVELFIEQSTPSTSSATRSRRPRRSAPPPR